LKVYNSIQSYDKTKQTIVTIGTFDGVHVGHKKIIERIVSSTENGKYESLILTFFPHPRMVLGGSPDIRLLNTLEEKQMLLEKTGLDSLVVHPFDAEFSQLSAEEFVKQVLVDAFSTKKIIIGHDHRFGKNRSADFNDLILFGEKYGFEVEQISVQEVNDVSVSSTKIRAALTEGNMEVANNFLGYDYMFTGKVVPGKQLGRTLGFPTANLEITEEYKLIPGDGVYIVRSNIPGVTYGMMNIGNRPTVDGTNRTIEIYYLDFSGDLYGQIIEIQVVKRIRSEQKFSSIDHLRQQLQQDLQSVKQYLQKL
jgi:riboflavin kinase/FMN adenylyltransferase